MYPTYRATTDNQHPGSTPGPYPQNLCRTMAPQVYQYRRIISSHFARRRKDSSPAKVRNWIAAYRRDMRACGWNTAAKAVNAAQIYDRWHRYAEQDAQA